MGTLPYKPPHAVMRSNVVKRLSLIMRPCRVVFGFTLTRLDRLGDHARYWTEYV